MKILKDFEKNVVQILTVNILSTQQINEVIQSDKIVKYTYTGCGYYLTIYCESLPEERIVCSEPMVFGEAQSVLCGFVIFIENKQLTIECHPINIDIPENYRDKNVIVNFQI